MLFAPALADRAILPTAWGSSHFFNRIGQKLTFGPFHFVQEAMLITLEFASISTRCLPCCRPAWTKN
ncbi:hypothetical protein IPC1293_30755 [Pseudomonas aeruginosa]|nr:hypothetical protein IPC1293_30755 [Pseudomonas aeruginosa]